MHSRGCPFKDISSISEPGALTLVVVTVVDAVAVVPVTGVVAMGAFVEDKVVAVATAVSG